MRLKFRRGIRGETYQFGVLLFALLLSIPASGQLCVTPLRSFGFPGQSGEYPFGGVIRGSDGLLYGTTHYGGSNSHGTVFRLNTNGFGYTVIHNFGAISGDGQRPVAGVIEASNGALYGTTWEGGISNFGTIFMVQKNGSGYQVLHRFTGANASPYAALMQASDGKLYGTTFQGGLYDRGTIFSIETNGANFQIIHSFGSVTNDGSNPRDSVIEASDGRLYTTTVNGGTSNYGTVVGVNKNGASYSVLLSFGSGATSGRNPYATVIEAGNGVLYGTTTYGSQDDRGTVFRINKDGSGYQILWHLGVVSGNPQHPRARLLKAANGLLYGTGRDGGSVGRGALFSLNTNGTSAAVLYSFVIGSGEGGVNPAAPLIEAPDGTFYSSSERGGYADRGTIFKYARAASKYTTLYSQNPTGGDGYISYGPAVLGLDGFLYGTCAFGGSNYGGMLFRCDTNGSNYSVLRHFRSDLNDGLNPEGGIIIGSDGRFYGTCRRGGGTGQGTIYRIDPTGSGYAVLYRFAAGGDGSEPTGELLEAQDGLLYGTTVRGGTNGWGTLFRIDKSGSGYMQLYSFRPGPDAQQPNGGLTAGPDGRLYGSTTIGGNYGQGTVFVINRNGSGYAILKHFGAPGEISYPRTPLLLAANLAFYGVTYNGLPTPTATIFRINTDGSGYAVVRSFPLVLAGVALPRLVQGEGTDTGLYGIDEAGGAAGLGAVYRLNPDGSNFQIVREFKSEDPGGSFPRAALRRVGETFYGMTFKGGDFGAGVIYRLAPTRTPALSLAAHGPGRGDLAVRGPAGCSCQIQYADPLAPSSWQNLTNLNLTAAPSTFLDLAATNTARIYRALLTP
jgi:uncharacterized repeat protein (TIGR03803 family)